MHKIRMTIGKQNEKFNDDNRELKVLHETNLLKIEGNQLIHKFEAKDGYTILICGNITGYRTKNGNNIPCDHYSASLIDIIENFSVDKCKELIEGEYLIVKVNGDGSGHVFSDRYGKNDLYIYSSKNSHIIVSDLSLLPIKPSQDGYDQIGLAHSLSIYGYRPAKKHTIYNNVGRLGTDEIIEINNGQINKRHINFIASETFESKDRELDCYADMLLEAIELRGSNYGNLVYLSSGWDSTAILAHLIHLYGVKKVRGVIARLLYSERSGVINQFEINRAKAIADYYGIELDIIDLDVRNTIPSQYFKYKDILKAHHLHSVTVLSHGLLADYVADTTNGDEAIFAGEISDGAHNLGFSQYTTMFHPKSQSFREYSDKMANFLFGPTFLETFLEGKVDHDPVYQLLCSKHSKDIFDDIEIGNKEEGIAQFLSGLFLRSVRIPLWSLKNNRMLTENGAAQYQSEMDKHYFKSARGEINKDTLYAWHLHLYNSFHWQSSTIKTLSVTALANKFPIQLPFWDYNIQEFLSTMPESWGRGLDLNHTKYPLKWTLKNRIDYPIHLQEGPHSYIYDVRPEFNIAGELVYSSAFTPFYKKELSNKKYHEMLSEEVFDLSYIDRVVDNYVAGEIASGNEFNDLVSLCLHVATGWY